MTARNPRTTNRRPCDAGEKCGRTATAAMAVRAMADIFHMADQGVHFACRANILRVKGMP
jgi:hypothetical protein